MKTVWMRKGRAESRQAISRSARQFYPLTLNGGLDNLAAIGYHQASEK